MDEMNTFERQLADESRRIAGNPRPVDVQAVFRATTAPAPRWSLPPLLGGTTVAMAGAIVALIGGLVIMALLLQPQSTLAPAATTSTPEATRPNDILPGVSLTTTEVEPGVYLVTNDGVRELARTGGASEDGAIVAGLDGSVWRFRPDSFYRLGDEQTHRWGDQLFASAWDDIEVGPDGTVWRVADPRGADEETSVERGDVRLLSFDGEEWAVRLERPTQGGRGAVVEVEVSPDGDVWVAWVTPRHAARVSRLEGDEWVALPGSPRSRPPFEARGHNFSDETLAVTDGGEVWFRGRAQEPVLQHDGSAWGEPLLGRLLPVAARDSQPCETGARASRPLLNVDVGPDGTGWLNLGRRGVVLEGGGGCWPFEEVPHLARFAGDSVADYVDRTDLPPTPDLGAFFEVSPDGSLWYGARDEESCLGLVNFDGTVVRRFLEDQCVHDADIAPDGSVWVQAGPDDTVIETYAVTAEAVAAAG